jgi:hypothetical protein
MSTQRLLIRPPICLNEGFLGYLKRVSDENGLPSLFSRRKKIGSLVSIVAMFDLWPQDRDHQKIEYIKHLDLNWNIHPHAWNRHYSRFCPECFKTAQVWRIEWELLFFDACPTHGCWLVDTCSSCGQVLSWERKKFSYCDCGAALGIESSGTCPPALHQVMKIMHRKIACNASPCSEKNVISHLSIEKIQHLIRFFGAYANIENNSRPQKISSIGSLNISWTITSVAAEILVRWPESLFMLLDKIYRYSDLDSTGNHRLNQHFGNFYDYLYGELSDADYDFIRTAFEAYLIANWRGQLAKRNKRISNSLFERSTWVPATYAAKQSGISVHQIRTMVIAGRLQGEERALKNSGRCYLSVKRTCIEELKRQKSEFLDLATMRRLLGLGKKRSSYLCEMLFPESLSPINDQRPTWGIPRADIEKILSIAKSLKTIEYLDVSSITVGHVIRYWHWSDTQIVNLIRQIQKYQFTLLGRLSGSVGIAGWVASKETLLDWFQTTFPDRKPGTSIVDVAKLLGIKQEVAYFLSRQGFIQTEEGKTKHGKVNFISHEALENFSRSYIFSSSIAKKWKTTSRCVLEIFQHHGVYPISGPNIDRGRQYLFEKTPQLASILHHQKMNLVAKNE